MTLDDSKSMNRRHFLKHFCHTYCIHFNTLKYTNEYKKKVFKCILITVQINA